jgi:hypothetical protein
MRQGGAAGRLLYHCVSGTFPTTGALKASPTGAMRSALTGPVVRDPPPRIARVGHPLTRRRRSDWARMSQRGLSYLAHRAYKSLDSVGARRVGTNPALMLLEGVRSTVFRRPIAAAEAWC